MNAEEYLRDRVDNQIAWYSRKSRWNQQRFKILRLIELVLATAIPFLVSLVNTNTPVLKIMVGAMGVTVAVAAGLVSLYKFQENWIEYRTTAEILKQEKFLFLTQSPPYDDSNAFHAFVSRIESLLSKEHSTWSQTFLSQPKPKSPA